MYTAVYLLKARPGMSRAEFVDYYENVHSKFIEHVPGVRHYVRRYVTLESSSAGPDDSLDFDVIMEVGFDSREAFERSYGEFVRTEHGTAMRADEGNLFDPWIRALSVDEHVTALAARI